MEKMRLVVLATVPQETRHERKVARQFGNALFKMGFSLLQEGVYTRAVDGRASAASFERKLSACCPECGMVRLFVMTERQFGESVLLTANESSQEMEVGSQLDIFL